MLEYRDFYDIAEYGNVAWKGSFTPREIAQNAYDYLCEFEESKRNNTPTHTIKELIKLLKEDESEECNDWLRQIIDEINDICEAEYVALCEMVDYFGIESLTEEEQLIIERGNNNE